MYIVERSKFQESSTCPHRSKKDLGKQELDAAVLIWQALCRNKQIQLGLVGLDMVLLVMGRELVSFKIVDAALSIDVASPAAAALESPETNPSAVTIALVVEDMSLRDMQASACLALGSGCSLPGLCEVDILQLRPLIHTGTGSDTGSTSKAAITLFCIWLTLLSP